ncbi:MAG: hypothetical protein AB7I19_16875 [Planctomycetota bacterium]
MDRGLDCLTRFALLALTSVSAPTLSAQDPDDEPLPNRVVWRDLVGQPCPKLPISEWLTGDGMPRTLEELEGRAFVFAILSTEPQNERTRPVAIELAELQSEFAGQGFHVVAAVYDNKVTGSKQLAGFVDGSYPMGKMAFDERLAALVDGRGYLVTPQLYVVDSAGNVVSHEMPTSESIAKLVENVWIPELGRPLHADLADAVAAYEARFCEVSLQLLKGCEKDADEALRADIEFLRQKCQRCMAATLLAFKTPQRNELSENRYGRALELVRQFGTTGDAQLLKQTVAELEKSPRVSRDMKLWKAVQKELDAELAAWKLPGDRRNAALVKAEASLRRLIQREKNSPPTIFATKHADQMAAQRGD